MKIRLETEPIELQYEVAEDCIFCAKPCRTWHTPTNRPICQMCSQVYTVAQIKDAPHNY